MVLLGAFVIIICILPLLMDCRFQCCLRQPRLNPVQNKKCRIGVPILHFFTNTEYTPWLNYPYKYHLSHHFLNFENIKMTTRRPFLSLRLADSRATQRTCMLVRVTDKP